MIFILDISNMDTTWQYCWWKKSCTSWYEEFLSIYRGFLHSMWFSRRISEPSIVANHQPFGFPLIDSNWLTNNLHGFSRIFPFFVNFHQQYFTTLSFFLPFGMHVSTSTLFGERGIHRFDESHRKVLCRNDWPLWCCCCCCCCCCCGCCCCCRRFSFSVCCCCCCGVGM